MSNREMRLLVFIIVPIIIIETILVTPTVAQPLDPKSCTSAAEFCWNCSSIGNYSEGSIYQKNLISLVSSFSNSTENKIDYGFYNSSLGQDPNTVNAIALCRGDLSPDACRNCINESSDILLRNCSYQKEALLWAELCMVRYSPNLIFGTEEEDPVKYLPSPWTAINAQGFKRVLNLLLANLSDRAASGDSEKKFAAGNSIVPGRESIYALLQCTPDIDKQNCSDCLNNSISSIPVFSDGKSGGRVLKPSCTLRYENNLFYESTAGSLVNVSAPTTPAASVPVSQGKSSNKRRNIIIIVVVIAFVSVLILSGIFIFSRRKRTSVELVRSNDDDSEEIRVVESLQYDFENIRSATNDFSDANKLGQGGFGAVYKGKLLNGQYVAVKRLSKSSAQGDREFTNEVRLLAQLQHRNLVRLLGFCLTAEERLLIYEFVPNASLDHYIFDPTNHGYLDWETRYKIIGGIARGLLYLHEDSRLRIIHRDLKPGNILLGEDMNPKIADFGVARLFVMDQTQADTKTIVGTRGYMAPEYASHGRFSVKSDVFSFGVIVLEIVSGKKIVSFQYGENEEDLLSYVWRNWREDAIENIIDPSLTESSKPETMRCIHIGLLCVQENVGGRPTMASVNSMLSSYSVTMPLPLQPAYSGSQFSGAGLKLTETSENSKSFSYASSNDVSNITEPYPR